jgi:Fe-S-cluster-containing dehydrogenase component
MSKSDKPIQKNESAEHNKKSSSQNPANKGNKRKLSRKDFLTALAATPVVAGAMGAPRQAHASEKLGDTEDFYGFLYDSTKCQGCRACVLACAKANGLPQVTDEKARDTSGDTRTSIRMGKQGLKAMVKANCMHCLHPSCVSACPVSAMLKDPERGFVYNDTSRCIGCRYCMVACPYEAIKFEWDDVFPKVVKCNMCHDTYLPEHGTTACVDNCAGDALMFGTRKKLMEEAKRRIRENPDRYNPKVYGEYDGGGTSILYLAAKGVSYEDLGFPSTKDLGYQSPATKSETLQETYKNLVAPAAGLGVLSFVVYHNYRKGSSEEEGSNE